uniref:(California timema) hypothetical protein n=1 Tax=Timema californicum TaxID=61474 RepID=A0A7R9JC82_TIMCA|nr:unnamed protein product [Timema californicum]
MIKLKQNSALLDVIVHTKKIFHRSLSDFRVICTRLPPPDLTFPIAKRYSHSACVHGAYNLVWSDELHQGIGIRAVEFELVKCTDSDYGFKIIFTFIGIWESFHVHKL